MQFCDDVTPTGESVEEPDDPEGFLLGEYDKEIIESLVAFLRRLVGRATSGSDLAGIGEAWDALEDLEEVAPDVSVSVSVVLQFGDEHFSERNLATLTVNSEGVELCTTNVTYSSDVGSDHESKQVARIGWRGGFGGDPDGWLHQAEEFLSQSGSSLSVSRDHI